jgi:hypothetical protein
MRWYRLIIPTGDAPELRLYDLCARLRSYLAHADGDLPSGTVVIGRPTAFGGYELRVTWPVVRAITKTGPQYYIQEVAGDDSGILHPDRAANGFAGRTRLPEDSEWRVYVGGSVD